MIFMGGGSHVLYHGTQDFFVSGTFTVPRATTSVTVYLRGGPGLGGGDFFDDSSDPPNSYSGTGGAAGNGEEVTKTITVVPGEVLTITLGANDDAVISGTFGSKTALMGAGGGEGSWTDGGGGGDGGGASGIGGAGGAGAAGGPGDGDDGGDGSSTTIDGWTHRGGGGGGGGGITKNFSSGSNGADGSDAAGMTIGGPAARLVW